MANEISTEYKPNIVSHPGLSLLDVIEEKGMSQKELSDRTGRSKKTINEIIKGKCSITSETAIQLEKALGISAGFWNTRQKKYDEYVAKMDEKVRLKKYSSWAKDFPVREMINNNWLQDCRNNISKVDELLKFFGVNSPDEWNRLWAKPAAVFRQSLAFQSNTNSVSAWLRKGELESHKINCSPYNKKVFTDVLKNLLPLTRKSPQDISNELVSLCSACGVAVVFVPPLKGVPVYGTTRWLTPDKALIQLSLRGHFEDMFWFSFFHEAGHILLHGKREIFIESSHNKGEKELEADEFARDFLIPPESWSRFAKPNKIYSASEVKFFADLIGVSAAIVVGRLHHEKLLPMTHLNNLRRRYIIVNAGNN